MFHEPSFWVAAAFFLFVLAVFKPVGRILINALDARSAKIQKELDEARSLMEEAQALLASYQRRQSEAAEEAQNIIKSAEAEARQIIVEAEKNLEESLNKKIQVYMQKISTYEHSVLQELRVNLIDVAVGTVRSIMKENVKKEVSEELVQNAINEMHKNLGKALN
jgi:F-type H+-transporting ATPase subunit b